MAELSVFALVPFVLMLAGIAVCPLILPQWWEKNTNKIIYSLLLALPTMLYLTLRGCSSEVLHQMFYDYLPFIVLVGTLFVVTGGINIKLNMRPTPMVNSLLLVVGFLLASLMGTTGAALLLVRPLLEINRERRYKAHLVLFFIALVANCGGLLTPLGDPPLFMLFLRGVPFEWFLKLFPMWLFAGGALLFLYFLSDIFYYNKEQGGFKASVRENDGAVITCSGARNFIYLLLVVLTVAFVNKGSFSFMADEKAPLYVDFLREIVLLAIAAVSWLTTDSKVRAANSFSWAPLNEVVVLFFGVFATMTPALLFLQSLTGEIGINTPAEFYYATGSLSSFLDNTPTAVAFHALAIRFSEGCTDIVGGVREGYLVAVSLGAVFFGSMTYIGNGPNFMVKAIAERRGVKMPGFIAYILLFSLPVLLPIFILVQLLFL